MITAHPNSYSNQILSSLAAQVSKWGWLFLQLQSSHRAAYLQ